MAPTMRTRAARTAVAASGVPSGPAPQVVKPRTEAVKTEQDSSSSDPTGGVAARKRRKVEVKTEDKLEAAPRPPIDYTGRHYQPSTLPVEPQFSVPDAMCHLIRFDPRFKGLFEAMKCRPFVEPFEALDPYRTLTTSIVGQQVSWMAARAINNRFRGLFGYSADDEEGFPSPADVAQKDVLVLKSAGLSLRKAEYVKSLAEHFLSGELSAHLLRHGTDEEITKALIAVRGIGQWTVDMFLIFSLRRPDIMPYTDLGVQKGLLRFALAAHNSFPGAKGKFQLKKKDKTVVKDEVDAEGQGELDTTIQNGRSTPPPQAQNGAPPTPLTPSNTGSGVTRGALHTPNAPGGMSTKTTLPPTPFTPDAVAQEVLQVQASELPEPAPEDLLAPVVGSEWDADRVAPLGAGLSIETMRSRWSGKKAKGGAYLTPAEMDALTEGWKPYRSLGVYYTWAIADGGTA